jgi:transcriptional regulator with XRE-family HTH domain
MRVVESWPDYVRRVSKALKQEQIAERTGISQATISAWFRGAPTAPKAETVIAFAKSFGQSPVKALVVAGYLDAADTDPTSRTALTEYSTAELFDELRRRTSE